MPATQTLPPVSQFGDYSDYIAPGHALAAAMVEACRRAAEVTGCPVAVGWSDAELAGQVTHRWAVLRDGGFEHAEQGAADAVPVTFLAVG